MFVAQMAYGAIASGALVSAVGAWRWLKSRRSDEAHVAFVGVMIAAVGGALLTWP
jgi:hypothetical protein